MLLTAYHALNDYQNVNEWLSRRLTNFFWYIPPPCCRLLVLRIDNMKMNQTKSNKYQTKSNKKYYTPFLYFISSFWHLKVLLIKIFKIQTPDLLISCFSLYQILHQEILGELYSKWFKKGIFVSNFSSSNGFIALRSLTFSFLNGPGSKGNKHD